MNEESETEKIKKPWPTKDAMEQIYEKKLWGGSEYDFYSGDGSHRQDLVDPYIEAVATFLKSFNSSLIVCDLGCGDFNVGKELLLYAKQYIAVDVAQNLIERNKEKFQSKNLDFHCLDIAVDDLPQADCVILRQVLQHLSNAEVHSVLTKLAKYKYLVLTEHLPKGDFIPNKDIISGQGIRIKKRSGLDILASPFNFQVKEQKQLVSIELEENKGVIVTTLYEVF
jgi:SAM-dependent methyltransferase